MSRNARRFRTDANFARCFPLLLTGLLVLGTGRAWAQAPELRTWTSGDYKVQAKFVSLVNGTVTLKQSDGEILDIDLEQLSAADQSYAKRQQRKSASSPFKKRAASPFQKRGAGRAMSTGGDAGSGGVVRPDWSGVQQLESTPSRSGWEVPIPSASRPEPSGRLRSVPIPRTTGFFQGSKGVVINNSGTRAVVAYSGDEPGQNKKKITRIAVGDLEKGALLTSAVQPGLYLPLALSDDGQQVVMRTDQFGHGQHGTLEIWNVSHSGVARSVVWIPYESANGNDRDVRWASYLGSDRLATISESGNLVIWQVQPLKPLATMAIQSGCTPALSPDGKLMAFATSGEIGLFDVDSLETIASQPSPMPNMAWASFAFSPTGKRLACKIFVNKVVVYDMANGSQYREISMHGINGQPTSPVFTDDDHMLIGDHTLIDLETQVRLWQYQGNEHVVASNGVCWFEVAARQNQSGALVPAKIPTARVKQSLERALSDPNFFIVKPGATVSIDVNGIPDFSRRNEVIQSLTSNLSGMGIKVAASSPVVFQASMEQGKEQQIAYRSIGRGFHVDRFKVRPWIANLKVVYNGKIAWQSGGSSMPAFDVAHLKKNESLQDHVQKFQQPNYTYFQRVELPKLVTRPTGQFAGTLGTSNVTTSGIR